MWSAGIAISHTALDGSAFVQKSCRVRVPGFYSRTILLGRLWASLRVRCPDDRQDDDCNDKDTRACFKDWYETKERTSDVATCATRHIRDLPLTGWVAIHIAKCPGTGWPWQDSFLAKRLPSLQRAVKESMFRETPFSLVANEMNERIKSSRLPSGLLQEPARSRGDNPDWNRPSRLCVHSLPDWQVHQLTRQPPRPDSRMRLVTCVSILHAVIWETGAAVRHFLWPRVWKLRQAEQRFRKHMHEVPLRSFCWRKPGVFDDQPGSWRCLPGNYFESSLPSRCLAKAVRDRKGNADVYFGAPFDPRSRRRNGPGVGRNEEDGGERIPCSLSCEHLFGRCKTSH